MAKPTSNNNKQSFGKRKGGKAKKHFHQRINKLVNIKDKGEDNAKT